MANLELIEVFKYGLKRTLAVDCVGTSIGLDSLRV